ncbi:cell division protein FtsQ/DivIB [bacterium]|nr:cell division protein FtsQ/DivIB [bacterium]MBU1598549.1 cell division protein FtsQ/DivIB [bacterium]
MISKRDKRRIKRTGFFLLVSSLIFIGVRSLVFSDLFLIKKIEVETDGSLKKKEVVLLFDSYCQENYLGIRPNLFRLERKSLRRFFLSDIRLLEVKIGKRPLNKLLISVTERKPFAQIGEGLCIDKDGVVFPTKETDLFYLYSASKKRPGDRIDVQELYLIVQRIQRFLPKYPIQEMRKEKDRCFFLIEDTWVSVLLKEKELDKKLVQLSVILPTLKKGEFIDLCYDDPILSENPSFVVNSE